MELCTMPNPRHSSSSLGVQGLVHAAQQIRSGAVAFHVPGQPLRIDAWTVMQVLPGAYTWLLQYTLSPGFTYFSIGTDGFQSDVILSHPVFALFEKRNQLVPHLGE